MMNPGLYNWCDKYQYWIMGTFLVTGLLCVGVVLIDAWLGNNNQDQQKADLKAQLSSNKISIEDYHKAIDKLDQQRNVHGLSQSVREVWRRYFIVWLVFTGVILIGLVWWGHTSSQLISSKNSQVTTTPVSHYVMLKEDKFSDATKLVHSIGDADVVLIKLPNGKTDRFSKIGTEHHWMVIKSRLSQHGKRGLKMTLEKVQVKPQLRHYRGTEANYVLVVEQNY